jgi:hypothetical protein
VSEYGYMPLTAAGLVGCLEGLRGLPRGNKFAASMIDEAAYRYCERSGPPAVAAAEAFEEALNDYWTEGFTPAAWDELLVAADGMAEALRPLGDLYVPFCQQPSVHDDYCGATLADDGTCPSSASHAPAGKPG